MVVAAFLLDISVFLSLPCTFEVYLRRWSFLEGCLEQDEAHSIDICPVREGPIRGGDPLGPTPLDIYLLYYLLQSLFLCFLLLGRIIIKEWGSSLTQRLKFSPPTILYLDFILHNFT